MTVFEKLTREDLDKIETYINQYGARNEGFGMNTTVENVLRCWNESKNDYLFKMMGENLILEKEIAYEKDVEELTRDINEQVKYSHDVNINHFYDDWESLAIDFYKNYGSEGRELCWKMRDMIGSSILAANRWPRENFTVPLPEGKSYVVSKDCKVTKAIGKIARAYSVRGYEDFRIAHSQTLNEKALKGTVCLSIHPLDYMTMSDNDCGWSSCMSWVEHGDFRQGTVEMMNSPMVVMAYLKSSSDYVIRRGFRDSHTMTWNSKRWRELFIVTNDGIMGIKGYPYWNHKLEAGVLSWLKELAEVNLGFGPYDDKMETYDADKNCVSFEDGHKIALSTQTNLMYNDCYSKHLIYLNKEHPEYIEFNYSGTSLCLCCGQELGRCWDTEADLFCSCCDPCARCSECGEVESEENMYYIDGRYVCQYCYEEYARECTCCGEEHMDLARIYFGPDKNHVDFNNYIDVCDDCYNYGHSTLNGITLNKGKIGYTYVSYITPESINETIADWFNYDIEEGRARNPYVSMREVEFLCDSEMYSGL